MAEIRFDTYYRYDAITDFMHGWAEKYPMLCRVESIGKSYEGRDIWVMIITNSATGPDIEKPAYWADGNIHATEVSPSAACLYLINKLLTSYGSDDRVTYALDSRTFYVVPRVNPDGAEWALADRPVEIRSSTRPYPYEEQFDGLQKEDIDGDGRLLQMRIKDPHGSWKIHPAEPRLMIQRAPDDPPGGDYYRLLPEGTISDYDGVTINMAPPLQGLDINRNFPVFWEPTQAGAGDFPGSEPEPRSLMEFFRTHPNISGGTSYHTFGGVFLRSPTKGADSLLPTADLQTFKQLGEKAKEITGYKAVSIYGDFQYDPKNYIKGTFSDWMYEFKGIYGWTCEIWSVQQQSGITDYKFIEWFREHPVDHDLKIFKWLDEELNGEGYIDWYEFDHPQLGTIELGGWHTFLTWRNPPYKKLEAEIAPLADFALYSCLILPKLELYQVDVTPQGGDTYHVRLVLHNTGWLPTNVTQQAIQMKVVKPIEVNVTLPEGASFISGKARTHIGQLRGRNHKGVFSIRSADSTDDRTKVDWVVSAPAGSQIDIVAHHDRAGTVRTSVELG